MFIASYVFSVESTLAGFCIPMSFEKIDYLKWSGHTSENMNYIYTKAIYGYIIYYSYVD